MKKLSLCICFYNAEKFIKGALDSLSEYLTDEIEVIMVNDGSIDRSKEIVLEYILKYPQIVLIEHEKNLGLSIASSTAVLHSNSEWIMFLDADDTILMNIFDYILVKIDETSADIIEYQAIDSNGNILKSDTNSLTYIDSKTYLEYFFSNRLVFHQLWLRVFKRKLFSPNPFPDYYELHQDTYSLPVLISRSNHVEFINLVVINYNTFNENSITNSQKKENDQKDNNLNIQVEAEFYLKLISHYNKNILNLSKIENYQLFLLRMLAGLIYNFSILDKNSRSYLEAEYELSGLFPKTFFKKFVFRYEGNYVYKFILFIFGSNFTFFISNILRFTKNLRRN